MSRTLPQIFSAITAVSVILSATPGYGQDFLESPSAVPTVIGPSGAAVQEVPIPTPPGTGGFAPKLALRYSSDAGDSPFGVGWSLALSHIRRSTRYGTPTFNDQLDTFELDGTPLVQTDEEPGRYHTFVESFRRVRTHLAGGGRSSLGK